MDYLKVDLFGGMYLEAQDWVFNQNGIKQSIEGLASLAGRNLLLSGVLPLSTGGGSITHAEGFVLIEGEVFYVPAASVTDNGAYIYVEVEETNDPNGYEVFEDGGAPQNTYIKRTGKIVSYAASQTETLTRKSLLGLKTFNTLVTDRVQGFANVFTKRQSLAQGADAAAVTGSAIITLADYTAANCYNVNIDTATVDLNRFSAPMPNGTWLAIRFTGSGTVVLTDGLAFSNGFDTQGKSFIFSAGEIALFVWMDGKARLVNGRNESKVWLTVGTSPAPAYQNSWALTAMPIKFIKDEMGVVTIIGSTLNSGYTTAISDIIFTLPVGYRPIQKRVIRTYDPSTAQHAHILIHPNGNVEFSNVALVAAIVSCSFDGVGKFETY